MLIILTNEKKENNVGTQHYQTIGKLIIIETHWLVRQSK